MTSVVQMGSSYLEQSSLIKTSIGAAHLEATRWEDSKPDRPCCSEWKHENIYIDTRVMRGTDVYSDHYLVKTRIRLKLVRAEGRKNVWERFDVSKLQSEGVRRRYNIAVRNRFEALGDINDPEEEHDMILATYRDAAKKVLGRSKKLCRPWIGSKT